MIETDQGLQAAADDDHLSESELLACMLRQFDEENQALLEAAVRDCGTCRARRAAFARGMAEASWQVHIEHDRLRGRPRRRRCRSRLLIGYLEGAVTVRRLAAHMLTCQPCQILFDHLAPLYCGAAADLARADPAFGGAAAYYLLGEHHRQRQRKGPPS